MCRKYITHKSSAEFSLQQHKLKEGFTANAMAKSSVRKRRKSHTDSGFAWIVALMSFCALFAVGANVVVLGVILPEFLDHFQFSQAMLGILGSVKIAVFDICSGECC